MKTLVSLILLSLSLAAAAQDSDLVRNNPELLAARGSGEVTLGNFEARVHRIPPEMRFPTIRNRGRFEEILNKLLIDAQLAAEATSKGFHEDPVVRERLELAMREELARAWIEHQVDEGGNVDYTAMAREEWMLNRDKYVTPETIDVAHILVSTSERSTEEAESLAQEIYAELQASPERFTELAETRSEDAGSAARGGTYVGVKRGDMVAPFENVAFSLEINEISEPVQTDYGFHVIRLDAVNPPEQMSFEAVRLQLETQARELHRERQRRAYLQPLYAEDIEVTPQSVENAVGRALGEEFLAREAGGEGNP